MDAALAEYRALRDAGRILPNSIEALRVELTYHSNAIEGSTLSLRETQLVIEGHAPTGGKTLREVYEARNHDRALRLIEQWAEERPKDAPLTDQDLLNVHAHVLADIDLRSAGRFRTDRVLIKGTRFIPPGSHRFAELVPKLLELANRPGVHPAVQAAELHYNFVAVHPFGDGNGRTARLLMNYHCSARAARTRSLKSKRAPSTSRPLKRPTAENANASRRSSLEAWNPRSEGSSARRDVRSHLCGTSSSNDSMSSGQLVAVGARP